MNTYFAGVIASDLYKLESGERERKAALKFRTRHLKSKEGQVLTAVVTNVLRLFVR
jgi:hypothetical protein